MLFQSLIWYKIHHFCFSLFIQWQTQAIREKIERYKWNDKLFLRCVISLGSYNRFGGFFLQNLLVSSLSLFRLNHFPSICHPIDVWWQLASVWFQLFCFFFWINVDNFNYHIKWALSSEQSALKFFLWKSISDGVIFEAFQHFYFDFNSISKSKQ